MIQVSHLTKYYGDFLAVNDLSFEIQDGHVYGFLGPNGAGKSTTMNIMTGCLSPTDGTVKIGGFDILEQPEAAKKADRLSPRAAAAVSKRDTAGVSDLCRRGKGAARKRASGGDRQRRAERGH